MNDLPTVIANLQGWIVGILAAVATLFLVIGSARYMRAGGDPSETERANGAFTAAAIGYAGAGGTLLYVADVTTLPQVPGLWSQMLGVVNVCYVIAIVAGFAVAHGSECADDDLR